MHKHTHQCRRNTNLSERRLCFRLSSTPGDLGKMHETMKANETIRNNPVLQEAITLYDTPLVRDRFEHLLQGQAKERPYTLALLLDGMMFHPNHSRAALGPDKIDYTSTDKEKINPADPFNLVARFNISSLTVPQQNAQIGEHLRTFLDVDTMEKITSNWGDDEKLGAAYRLIVTEAQIAWRDHTSDIRDQNLLFVDVSLLWHDHIRQRLDERMHTLGVRPPSDSMEFPGDSTRIGTVASQTLTRQEYLKLLRESSENGSVPNYAKPEALINAGKITGTDPVENRLMTVFTDIGVEKLGPTETLEHMGIDVGPYTRQRYADGRMAVSRDSLGVPYTPRDGIDIIPSAAEGSLNPKLGYEFLLENMPASPGSPNQRFLASMEWHFVFTDAERASRGKPLDCMEEDDTRATLQLIAQSLLEYQGRFSETMRQRKELQEEISLSQGMEDFMGNAWEYMKDFSSHPLGSALMWAAAYGAVRYIHGRFLKGEMSAWKIGVLGYVAYNVFQKHETGRNHMDWALEKYDEWMGNEKLLDAKERTLPNYWLREMKDIAGEPGLYDDLTPDKERLSLALIGEAPTEQMLAWYEAWGVWRNASSSVPAPPLPVEYGDYYNQLGDAITDEQVGNYLYLTLNKFFVHRGKEVKRVNISYDIPGEMSEDEGLGFAYVKEKYITHRFYRGMVERLDIPRNLKGFGATFEFFRDDGSKMTLAELQTEHPEFYIKHVKFLAMSEPERERYVKAMMYLMRLYDAEKFGVPTRNYPFDHVFYMEGNPEVILQRDKEDAEGAGFLKRLGSMLPWFGGGGGSGVMPSGGPGISTRLPVTNPGRLRATASANPGRFLQVAQRNPGQVQTIATTHPDVFAQVAVDNAGTFKKLVDQHPGVFENLATTNPGVMVQIATDTPGALLQAAEKHPNIAINLAQNHPTEFVEVATKTPGMLLILAEHKPGELRNYVTANPSDFLTTMTANTAVLNELAVRHQAEYLQLATTVPKILLILAGSKPETLNNIAAADPVAVKTLFTNNPVVYNKFKADHPAVHTEIQTTTPAALP